MLILQELIAGLEGKDSPVRAVCAGAFWTAVTTRHTGLATTCRPDHPSQDPHAFPVKDSGSLLEKSAGELAEYALSADTLNASLGLAAINSLIDLDDSVCIEKGAFEVLASRGRGRDVAVVGHFPFVDKLRPLVRNLYVIEKRLRPGDLPESEAARVLPRCQVVCISGTTLINHTLEGLLSFCRGSYVVLTGPSSPLTPLLFDHGIDVVCGTRVVDPAEVFRYVSQAASFRQIHGHGVRLLAMAREPRDLA
ncbi:MAG: DUF364 domain-containing protein [Candidatus Aminicenantes bacterium]|nr:DUF364 domain-containing protein [Candidatus Aminicenantes bacterium]